MIITFEWKTHIYWQKSKFYITDMQLLTKTTKEKPKALNWKEGICLIPEALNEIINTKYYRHKSRLWHVTEDINIFENASKIGLVNDSNSFMCLLNLAEKQNIEQVWQKYNNRSYSS